MIDFFKLTTRKVAVAGIIVLVVWLAAWIGGSLSVPLFPGFNAPMVVPPREDVPSPQIRKFLEQHEKYVAATRRRNLLAKLFASLILAYLGACVVDKGIYSEGFNLTRRRNR